VYSKAIKQVLALARSSYRESKDAPFDVSDPLQVAAFLRGRNPQFDRHCIGSRSASDILRTLSEYYSNFLRQLEDDKLLLLRHKSLLASLISQGYSPRQGSTARQNLINLSRLNLGRIARDAQLDLAFVAAPEVEELVSRLELVAYRDSRLVAVSGPYVLSSRRIEEFGFIGGLNSQYPFNRDFLASDDNVFFHLQFSTRDNIEAAKRTEFGDHRSILRAEYAKEHGWISPYVMEPSNLARFCEYALPGLHTAEELLPLHWASGAAPESYETDLARELRGRLHEFDFTYSDLDRLLRAQLRRALTQLKASPRVRQKYNLSFSDFQREVRESKVDNSAIRAMTENELHLPRLELKIPVLVEDQGFINGELVARP
jgi:hypothetical protein